MNYNNNPTLRESIQTPTESHNSENSNSISQRDDNEYKEDMGLEQETPEKRELPLEKEESKIDPNIHNHNVNDQTKLNGENLNQYSSAPQDFIIQKHQLDLQNVSNQVSNPEDLQNAKAKEVSLFSQLTSQFETQSEESGDEKKSQKDQLEHKEISKLQEQLTAQTEPWGDKDYSAKSEKIVVSHSSGYQGQMGFQPTRDSAFGHLSIGQSAFTACKILPQDNKIQQYPFKPQNILLTNEDALNASLMSSQLRFKPAHDTYITSSVSTPPANCNQGRWSKAEHCKFLEALKLYGKNWKKVQQHVQTRTSTQARSHAQKFFVKLDRKNIDLQSFLDSLDINNLNNMASELLEFEDDDEGNSHENSLTGSKRLAATSVASLEKKDGSHQPSKFKPNEPQKQQHQQIIIEKKKEEMIKIGQDIKTQDQQRSLISGGIFQLTQAATYAEQNHNQMKISLNQQVTNPQKPAQPFEIQTQTAYQNYMKVQEAAQKQAKQEQPQPKDEPQKQQPQTPHKSAFSQVRYSQFHDQQPMKPQANNTPIKTQPQVMAQQQQHVNQAQAAYYGIPALGGYPQFSYAMPQMASNYQSFPSIQLVNTPQGVVPYLTAGQYGQIAPMMYPQQDIEQFQQLFNQQAPVVYAAIDPMTQQMQYYPNPYPFYGEMGSQLDLNTLNMLGMANQATNPGLAQYYQSPTFQVAGMPQGLGQDFPGSNLPQVQQQQMPPAKFVQLTQDSLKQLNSQGSPQTGGVNPHYIEQPGNESDPSKAMNANANQNQIGLMLRNNMISSDIPLAGLQPIHSTAEKQGVENNNTVNPTQ